MAGATGATPCTSWVGALVDLDDHGYIRTGIAAEPAPGGGSEPEDARRRAMLETSQPGILAAGDVRSGTVKRVAAAVGDGAIAVRLALEHVHFG
jgi:thioredoxin reductase (NADPH)